LEKEANILNKILEKLKIKKAILFGHSDGGSISLIAAAKYPTKIAGIITEGAHVFVEDITLNGIREVVDAYKNTDLKNKLSKYHGTKVEAVFTAWSQTWLHPEYKDWNIEKFLSEIHCPSLIIQGANDEFGSEKQVDAIVSQVNGKSFKCMIPNAGHNPHKEAAKQTLEKVIHFVTDLTKG